MLALRSSIATATRRPCIVSYLSRTLSTPTLDSDWMASAFEEPSPSRHKDTPPVSNAFPKSLLLNSNLDLPKYRLHCKSTHNNTIITLTNSVGQTISWQSGGRCEFNGANRASYEAGYQSAVRIFRVIEDLAIEKNFKLALFLKGFGQGRDALKTALLSVEGQNIRSLVCSITDRTPIKIGGTRSKKTRRL